LKTKGLGRKYLGKKDKMNKKIFMTYDNRRDNQIKVQSQTNPQYFDMTKINQ
jgi:hypothetical protein